MDKIAKKRRAEGEKNGRPVNIWGPNELRTFKERFSVREILTTWARPFRMFLTEPIVLVLSLLSGFSDAIIFMFLQSYALVYEQWHFKPYAIGLAFIAIGIGYFLAWFSFFPAIKRNERLRRERPGDEQAFMVAALHGAVPTNRSYHFRLDVDWPTTPLDGHHGWICNYRYCQLRHLHGDDRLHDLRIRPLLGFCDWWQRMGSRFSGRRAHFACYSLLSKHWEGWYLEAFRVCVDDSLRHLTSPRCFGLRYLLEGSRTQEAKSIRTAAQCRPRREWWKASK
jgi:hypothetical protein